MSSRRPFRTVEYPNLPPFHDNRHLVAYQECFEDLENRALNEENTIAMFDDLIANLHRT